MRFLRLNLAAFGSFTDQVLDLSGGEQGLHLVYGPNEAGKSTALKAIQRFLFGFPHQVDEDFLHPMTKLRVGATLRLDSGEPFTAIRRKGRVNTLYGPDDVAVVDEALLRKALRNMDQGQFTTLLGIDHAELREGGEKMVKGSGEVGQLLFGAGAGLAGLRRVQEGLRAQADELFRPRGATLPINAAKKEYEDLGKELREAMVQAEAWNQAMQGKAGALEERGELAGRLAGLESRRARLARLREARPHVSAREELLARLAGLADAVLLRLDFSEDRMRFRMALDAAGRDAARALERLERNQAELDKFPAELPELDLGQEIEALHQEFGSYDKAMRDKPGVESRLAEARSAMQRILDRLPRLPGAPGPAEAEQYFFSREQAALVERLGEEFQRLSERRRSAARNRADLTPALRAEEEELAALKELPDAGPLAGAVRRIRKAGDMEGALRDGLAECDAELRGLEASLARQNVWRGTLKDLETLPLPLDDSVQRFEARFADLAEQRKALRVELDQGERKARDLAARKRAVQQGVELPSPQDLTAARAERDAGFVLVKLAWRDDKEDAQAQAVFIERFKGQNDLARAYEASVRQADDLADRLGGEASRVAELASLAAEEQDMARRTEQAALAMQELEAAASRMQEEWRGLWLDAAIEPLPPAEMRTLLTNFRDLAKRAVAARERRAKVETLRGRMDGHVAELCGLLGGLGQKGCDGTVGLETCLERCEQILEALAAQRAARDKREESLSRTRQELLRAEAQAQEAEQAIERWRSEWAEAVAPLGLPETADPSRAAAVLQDAQELKHVMEQAAEFERRVKGMERDAEAFAGRLANAVRAVAPDLASAPVGEAASGLLARLNQAVEASTRRKALLKLVHEDKAALEQAREQETGARSGLDALCREAGCADPDGLERAERLSAERSEAAAALARIEELLRSSSQGETLEAFVREARDLDQDQSAAELARLDQDIADLDIRRAELDRTLGGLEAEIRAMESARGAADLAQARQELLARMERDVERVARLRMAGALLDLTVQRFREKNQGPMLARSSELFQRLTLGSFSGLRLEAGDAGGEELMGVRADGVETVPVQAMSDGAADQLYLAVRLAGLEAYIRDHGPMPFLADDILVNFDDERAAAALDVLAELSEVTQVIFFTHHRHLASLAGQRLPGGVLFSHELA